MLKAIKAFFRLSVIKTLLFNLRVFPFGTAVRLPVLLGRHIRVRGCGRGSIVLPEKPSSFMLVLGVTGSRDLDHFNPSGSSLIIEKGSRLVIKGSARLARHFSVLIKNGASLTLGDGFTCNNGCTLSCVKGITVGDDVLLGGNIALRDSDGHKIYNDGSPSVPEKEIIIGGHVWICNDSVLLKGAEIAAGSIVAHSSVVTSAFYCENALIAGSPARQVKERVSWEH